MSRVDVQAAAVLIVCAAACVTDLRARRVPNALTFGAAAVALAFHAFTGGWSGLGWSAAGWLAGVALFAPFFVLGGMGAGDVKLLAAIGAWLGPMDAVWTALYTMIAGGVLAVVVSFAAGYLRQALTNVWLLLGYWRMSGIKPLPQLTLASGTGPRLAYSLPVTVGVLVTLWLQ
jgi:prepilin peptidase CpaA